MALNYAGVGFSLAAEDHGLFEAQAKVLRGLNDIESAAIGLNRATSGMDFTGGASAGAVNEINTAYMGLGDTVGDYLPGTFDTLGDSFDSTSESAGSLSDAMSSILDLGGSVVGLVAMPFKLVGKTFGFVAKGIIGLAGGIVGAFTKGFSGVGALVGGVLTGVGEAYDTIKSKTDMFTSPTGAGGVLTTAREATFVAYAKDARSMGANLGLAGKELGKFTGKASGLADGMGISIDNAGKAVYAYSSSQKELANVGIKSLKELAMAQEVMGLDASEFTSILKSARQEFGLSDEATNRLVGSFQAFGTEAGDIGGALKELPAVMDTMRKRAAQMGHTLDQADLEKFATQTASLAAGFYRVTKDSKKSMEMAQAMAGSMVQSREGWGNMFAGIETDMSDSLQSIGIGTGDIGVAFASMKQGPAEFTAGLAKMVQQAKATGRLTPEKFDFLAKYLTKAFPENGGQLASFMRNADADTLALMAHVEKAPADLGKVAKAGFSTGRTLDESFQRSKDIFISSFRAIGKSAAVDFVSETGKEFTKFNKTLHGMVDAGGPMAGLITKMSEIHQIGGLALVPKTLRPMAAVFGTVLEAVGPTAAVFKNLGVNMTDLLSPSGLLLGTFAGLAGWFGVLMMEKGATVSSVFQKMGDGISSFVEQIPMYVDKAVEYVDNLFTSLYSEGKNEASKVKWGEIWDRMVKAFTKAWNAISHVVTDVGKGIWTALTSGIDPAQEGAPGMQKLGFVLGDGLHKAWLWVKGFVTDTVWPMAKDFIGGVWDVLTGAVDPDGDGASGARGVGEMLGTGLSYALGVLGTLAKGIWDEGLKFVGGFWDGITGNTGDPTKISDAATKLGAQLAQAVEQAWGAISESPAVAKIGDYLGKVADSAWNWMMRWVAANPGKAALLGFASGGAITGALTAAFAVGGSIGTALTGGDKVVAEQLRQSVNRAVANATLSQEDIDKIVAEGGTYGEALKKQNQGFGPAMWEMSQQFRKDVAASDIAGSIHPDFGRADREANYQMDKIITSGNKQIERFAAFANSSTSDIDKRHRDVATEQLSKWLLNSGEVAKAWNQKFGGSMSDTMRDMSAQLSLDDDTYYNTVKALDGLDDLGVKFKYTYSEMKDMVASGQVTEFPSDFRLSAEEFAKATKSLSTSEDVFGFLDGLRDGLHYTDAELRDAATSLGVTGEAFDQWQAQTVELGASVEDLGDSLAGSGVSQWASDTVAQFTTLMTDGSFSISTLGTTLMEFGQGLSSGKVKEWAAGVLASVKGLKTDSLKEMAAGALGSLGLGDVLGTTTAPTVGVTTEDTYVQKSKIDEKALQGNIDTITKATLNVAKNMDAPLRKAVSTVLEEAFEKAYKNITPGTVKFAAAQVTLLKTMASDIKTAFIDMWIGILDATAIAVKALRSDVLTTLPMLKAVKAAAESSRAADKLPDLPEKASRENILQEGNAYLVAAMDWPAWYTEEYRAWAFSMKQSLEAMTLAVVAGKGNLGSTQQTGTTTKAIDELKQLKKKAPTP